MMARGSRAAAVALLLTAAPALSGCIVAAAAIPIAAGAAVARKGLSGSDERRAEMARPAAEVAHAATTPATTPATPAEPAKPIPVPPPVAPPPGMQYLYGSGEAAALSIQAYQALWNYLNARVTERKAGMDVRSVVLARNGTLEAPKFAPCGKKPLAVVFDIDETVLLNLGYEHDASRRTGDYDDARWKRWEATGADKVAAVPGAIETIDAARRAGIVVVFNSNRSTANAGGTIAAIAIAGLGSAEVGKTLWLRDEGPGTGGKDARRAEIADKYCVIGLVGDQLGDFSDLFNPGGIPVAIRRNMVKDTLVSAMWGSGWFILPNPVYGTGLHGGFDDVFPADKRWTDPADPIPEVAPSPAAAPAPEADAPGTNDIEEMSVPRIRSSPTTPESAPTPAVPK